MKKGSAMGIRTERRALWAARAFGAAGLAAACMDPAGVSLTKLHSHFSSFTR